MDQTLILLKGNQERIVKMYSYTINSMTYHLNFAVSTTIIFERNHAGLFLPELSCHTLQYQILPRGVWVVNVKELTPFRSKFYRTKENTHFIL